MKDHSITILAPHPDDDIIGCFSILTKSRRSNVHIIYAYPCSTERSAEAIAFCEEYSYVYTFLSSLGDLEKEVTRSGGKEGLIYVPNITDSHHEHKRLNLEAKRIFDETTLRYYSVDMPIGKPLSPKESLKKKQLLYTYYPSQQEYFDQHPQCYLFEQLVDSDIKSTITVKTTFAGVHCYPNAPDEVAFLRYPHRHDFHVRVTLSVAHDDRDVEFFILKREIDRFIGRSFLMMENKSCEMVAGAILNYCIEHYPGRDFYSATVGEDNQNEATKEFKVY